jgi:hypothetical protein
MFPSYILVSRFTRPNTRSIELEVKERRKLWKTTIDAGGVDACGQHFLLGGATFSPLLHSSHEDMYSSIGLKTVVLHGWVVWFRLDLELFAL